MKNVLFMKNRFFRHKDAVLTVVKSKMLLKIDTKLFPDLLQFPECPWPDRYAILHFFRMRFSFLFTVYVNPFAAFSLRAVTQFIKQFGKPFSNQNLVAEQTVIQCDKAE